MSLESGRRLAHYEIVASIGRGGMGEVYRAHDAKLGRDVAVKVLPEEFTRDRERLDRFEREARLLAQLNHANIATLHGVEEADGIRFLVMELVDGETLGERIAHGRLSSEEATRVFVQVADGLEAAHAKGIVHRDLKPANVKITDGGAVKILDFGLAKAVVAEASSQSESPTMTRATTDGVILGTAPYMSPEQARGQEVDAQTDIWAFGCCLYEALVGRAAFRGETVSDTLARVLEREPDWNRLPAATPPSVRTLLERTLAKEKRRRLHHIGDVRLELESEHEVPLPVSSGARYNIVALVAVSVLVVALSWNNVWRDSDDFVPVTRSLISAAPSDAFAPGYFSPSVAISPDGRFIAFIGESAQLYLRAVDQFVTTAISGSEGAVGPFFSPDSEWLGFWANGRLLKVSVHGGATTPIADTQQVRGASWGSDGVIFFAGQAGGISRVSSDGGTPEVVTRPDRENREKTHRLPHVLPGFETLLFTLASGDVESFDDASIALLSLETGEYRNLLAGGSNPRYSLSGHIVYARDGGLWAVPFDPAALEMMGPPVRIVEDVAMSNVRSGTAEFAVSQTGHLVYARGGELGVNRRVTWVDRRGNSEVLVQGPGTFDAPRVSPDGMRVALVVDGANSSTWIYDRDRQTLTRFASGFDHNYPFWTPDGLRVSFATNANSGPTNLAWKPADGSGESERISRSDRYQGAGSWSRDASVVTFESEGDIWVQSSNVGERPRPLLAGRFVEEDPMISPDGEWIAYTSNESGQYEIYLSSFPEPGAKTRVSTDGGRLPRWPASGRELFYWSPAGMMIVDIGPDGAPVGKPRVLFEANDATKYLATPPQRGYDVAPDGQHFVIIEETEPDPAPTHLNFVTNWASELERLVPSNR